MNFMILFLLLAGLAALVLGGEFLIKGASSLALKMKVSPLVIGLTIVAFGTSSPELVVSLQSTLLGNANMAIANVVGSNIFNIFLILGLCALIKPLIVSSQLVRLDVPLMIFASFLCLFFSMDGVISFFEGLCLFLSIIVYTVFLIFQSRKESSKVNQEFEKEFDKKEVHGLRSLSVNIFYVAIGLGLLVLGGSWFVKGAISLAEYLEISETVIGLTIVAAGTSLPELVTSLLATARGKTDIAIGNIVGSNIYNIFAILGLSSLFAEGGLLVSSDILFFDLPNMIAAAVVCLPIFISGFKINRWEGLLFLVCYIGYTSLLVLKSTGHSLFSTYLEGLVWIVGPALGLSLMVITYQAFRELRTKRFT